MPDGKCLWIDKSMAVPKLYIPSTYYKHFLKMVLSKAIWADIKAAGFWKISLYIK